MRILLSHHGASEDRLVVEELATALLAEGHHARVIGPARGLPGTIPALLRLRRLCRAFQPNLIYERHAAGHRATVWFARRSGISCLLAVGSLPTRSEQQGWRGATRLLTATAALSEAVAAAWPDPPPITVLPNAARADLLLPPPFRATATGGLPTIGVVGDVAMPGLDVLPRTHRLSEIGASTDPALLPMLAAACDVGLLPAVDDWASPPALFALMAAGRPVVAPDQANLREILQHEQTALLFDPADPAAMPAAVLRLTTDPALAQALGSAAQQAVAQRGLTWDAAARRIAALAAAIG